jgi:hypothetical protein
MQSEESRGSGGWMSKCRILCVVGRHGVGRALSYSPHTGSLRELEIYVEKLDPDVADGFKECKLETLYMEEGWLGQAAAICMKGGP